MTAQPQTEERGIGDNFPPSDIELMQSRCVSDYEAIFKRADVLIDSGTRLPEKCTDEETESKLTDFVSYCTKNMKDLDGARVKEKAPVLDMGRAVDAVFSIPAGNVEKAKKKASGLLTDWQREKARIARQAEIDAAEALRKEAELTAAQAAKQEEQGDIKGATATLETAAAVENKAVKHEAASVAKASTLTQARGSAGAQSSLRTTWKVDITDRNTLDLELLRPFIPADALQIAANAYIKTLAKPVTVQSLRGANIFEHTETVVR